jgi:hypothetical protein
LLQRRDVVQCRTLGSEQLVHGAGGHGWAPW